LDTVILGASPASEIDSTWQEKLKNLNTKHLFENGVETPFILDLMFAEKPFAPKHRDNSELDGKKYKISRHALDRAVKNGHFMGLPIFFFDPNKPDHGFKDKNRRTIGHIHDAIVREDERGYYVQALCGVYKEEFDMGDLKESQMEIGGSPELGIPKDAIDPDGRINEFHPMGALLLKKNLAAFKDTQLYCSDATTGEGGSDNIENEDKKTCEKPKTEQGGMNSMFCEKCAPVAEKEIDKKLMPLLRD